MLKQIAHFKLTEQFSKREKYLVRRVTVFSNLFNVWLKGKRLYRVSAPACSLL